MNIDGKLYEATGLEHEAIAGELHIGLEIVARFVRDKKRILTGGVAIDFAMRAKGTQLYPDEMLAFPDYDFVTPESVADSQDIADILYEEKLPNVSAIRAMHVQTRRTRIDNRTVADATYMPPDIYAKVPYIEYDGFRIVAPTYQRMDQHLALSRPFLGTPTESVFNRYKKDVERFNMLDEYYPIEVPDVKIAPIACSTVADYFPKFGGHDATVHGHAAYAVLYETVLHELGVDQLDGVVAMRAKIESGQLKYDAATPELQLLIEQTDDKDRPKTAHTYRPLLDLIPESWRLDVVAETSQRPSMRTEIWRYDGMLIPVGTGHVGDQEIIVPSVQNILLFMLTKYFFGEHDNDVHLVLYKSLLRMLEHVETHYMEKWPLDKHPEKYEQSPFFLPLNTIGSSNTSESQVVSLIQMKSMMGERNDTVECLPSNYWPPKSHKIDNYQYDKCPFFMHDGKIDGERKTKNNNDGGKEDNKEAK